MRKIEEQAGSASMNAEPFRSSNTQVKILPNVTVMLLHGNEIAYKYNDPKQTISVTTAGWSTQTTLSRLNSIPSVSVSRKKGKLFLNGEEWDGKLTDIN